MFKKVWLLMLAFLLVLSPVLVSADTTETDKIQSEEANETQSETDQSDSDTSGEEDDEADEPTEEDTNTSEAKSEGEATKDAAESKDNTDEENADDDDSDKAADTEKNRTNEADQTAEEDAEADDQVDEEETITEENEEEEIQVLADDGEEDEDVEIDPSIIHGSANANNESPGGHGITYDFEKGYYVLDMQAGLGHRAFTDKEQDINNKWVAFALPNGIEVADELPSGVVSVPVAGHDGIAVKIPNIPAGKVTGEYVYPKIPLKGEVTNNDPVLNLYIYDVDIDSMQYENLGQVHGQRDISFSVMEANPQLDLHGSIAGEATFNSDKGYYMLDVTVMAQNQTDANVNDLYAGFALPEGVKVLENDDTPANIQPLELEDGTDALAVKLPELNTDTEREVSYQIPVTGVSAEVVEASTINVYKINGSYQPVGQFEGSISVDFSQMTEQWDFDAKAQIVKDYPGLDNGQFGLNFAFNASNLTIDDVDKVKVEFNVPEDITVHEPDEYTQGDAPDALKDFLDDNLANESLDIEWDGNTAIINLDTVNGASGYEGFFSAFGESSKALKELEGINVLVTLYQNGNETVKEINVPFDIVSHEGEDPSEEDDQNGDDEENGETPGKGEDGNNGNDDNNGSDNENNNNNDSDKNKGTNNNDGTDGDKKDKDKDKDDAHLEIGSKNDSSDDNDDDEVNISSTNDSGSGGWELPNTATNMFTFMLIGSILAIAGGALMFFRKKELTQE